MDVDTAAYAAAVIGAIGSAVCLGGRARVPVLFGLALLVLAEAGLGYSLVPASDVRVLVASPVRIAAVVVALGVLGVGAAAFVRFPAAAPVALLVVAPIRLPVELGAQEAFLLVPLYAVLVAVVLAFVFRWLTGADVRSLPAWLWIPVSAFVAVAAVSLLWSSDLRAGTIELFFFFFPFVVLLAVVSRSPYPRWLPRALAITLVSLALVFSAIGIWQLWSNNLFFAPDLEKANAYSSYLRTASIFADSSIYGRILVLAIVIVIVALWLGGLRVWLGAVLIAALWTALFFTYSQSSMVALVAAALVVSVLAADRGSRLVLVGATLAMALVVVGATLGIARGESVKRATSARSTLVETTTRVFYEHPVAGVGLGGQPLSSSEERGTGRPKERSASHTTPLTVAAEMGVIGLAAYVIFLVGAVRTLIDAYRSRPTLGLALIGVFVTLVVHSFFYSGFFQDPLTWGSLGIAAASLAAASTAVRRA